jgi:hypothetical protein
MKLSISSVDYAPEELYEQTPFIVKLLRQIPGPDRPDYWLGELESPLNWNNENILTEITHLILAARWVGTQIEPFVENLPVGIAYVTDPAQLQEKTVDFGKRNYVAIGIATEIEGGKIPKPLTQIIAGNIARAFGKGKSS